MKNKIFYHLGNFLILASFVGFTYILYPLLSIYVFPPGLSSALPKEGIFITIPKIHAQASIVENVDPLNESEYKEALKKGVAQARGTNFFFAHSSGMPWEMTHMNTIFLRLGELQKGDIIKIDKNGKSTAFRVTEKKEVMPTEVDYLFKGDKNKIVLQTCTPIGTSLKRLLVFAEPL
jgi:LPXTG-site transpeptidase (sortase) family protein